MTGDHFPSGWDREQVHRILEHYETQTDEEAVAEDDPVFGRSDWAVVEVPAELMPVVREIIAQFEAMIRPS